LADRLGRWLGAALIKMPSLSQQFQGANTSANGSGWALPSNPGC